MMARANDQQLQVYANEEVVCLAESVVLPYVNSSNFYK